MDVVLLPIEQKVSLQVSIQVSIQVRMQERLQGFGAQISGNNLLFSSAGMQSGYDLEEEDEDDIDIHAFEELKGLIPDPDARERFAEMANLTKGSQATSESARSSASRMEALMFQMGQEHVKMVKAQDAEKGLMRRANQLLKKTFGLVRKSRTLNAQQAEGSAVGQAAGSQQDVLEGDREVRSRPSEAPPQD